MKTMILVLLMAMSVLGRDYDDHYWRFVCGDNYTFAVPPGIPASCYKRIPDRWTFEVDTTWDYKTPATKFKYAEVCDTTWTPKQLVYLSEKQMKRLDSTLTPQVDTIPRGTIEIFGQVSGGRCYNSNMRIAIRNSRGEIMFTTRTDTLGRFSFYINE